MYFVNLLAFYEMLLCYHVLTSFYVEEAHPALLNEDHRVLAAHVQLVKKLDKPYCDIMPPVVKFRWVFPL